MPDFSTITLQQAQELLSAKSVPGTDTNRLFYDGDHWQDAQGWIGPWPVADGTIDAATVASTQLAIKTGFVSKNVIRETVNRHRDGVIGREPTWSLTVRRPMEADQAPSVAEQALIDEAEALLTEWWDERKAHRTLKALASALLYSERASLRLFVPRGQQLPGAIVPIRPLAESVRRIYLHAPGPDQAGVYLDPSDMTELGIYVYEQPASALTAGASQSWVELCFLDEQGQTVIRILDQAGVQAQQSRPLDLGGRLTVFEAERELLITEQVRQNQRLLNQALSMLPRNVNLGGFLERVILNAQMPGEEDADGNFVPTPYKVGAGTTNYLSGIPTEDANTGKVTLTSPSVVYRDPVPVKTFEDTKRIAYQTILEDTEQVHALIAGDATASGVSRQEARDSFEKSLMDTKAELDRAGRWLLETLLALAAAFAGQPDRFETLRAVFECRVDSGPKSADENRQVIETFAAGLYSQETAMSLLGVEDTDAEMARMNAEREADISAGAARAAQQAEDVMHADVEDPPTQPDSAAA